MTFWENKFSASLVTTWVIFIFLAQQAFHYKAWEKDQVFMHDAKEYYSFLPALFIHGDIQFNYFGQEEHAHAEPVPLIPTNHGFTVKRSIGQAVMFLPWFLAGYGVASLQDESLNGYETPFEISIIIGALIYAFLAMWFLRRILLSMVGEMAASMALVTLFLATNLFYYSAIHGAMTHVHSTFLFSLFIWLTIQWYKQPSIKKSALLGLVLGMIIIVRPTNAIVSLAFLLYDPSTLASRFRLWFSCWKEMIALAFALLLPLSMQMGLWWMQTDKPVFYSYGDERFFWTDSEVLNGLFSYRNGLFPYAPMLILVFPGLVYMWRKKPHLWLSIFLFMFLNTYIIYSWWCWWYGGALGSRAAIEGYVFMIIPVAFLYQHLQSRKIQRALIGGLLAAAVILNLSNVRWFTQGVLHYDAMTSSAYLNLLAHGKQPEFHFDRMREPDYEGALRLGRERYNDWHKMTPDAPFSNTLVLRQIDKIDTTIAFGIFSSLKFPEATVQMVVSANGQNGELLYYHAVTLTAAEIGGRGWNQVRMPIHIVFQKIAAEVRIYVYYTGKTEAYFEELTFENHHATS